MAGISNKPPGRRITGIRGSIPSGYLLGRTDQGEGDVQLVSLKKAQGAGLIPSKLPPSGPAGGDLSGTYPNPTVAAIQGKSISTAAPTSNQVLMWITAASKWVATTIGLIPAGGTTGQVLAKNSNTDYDVAWESIATGSPGSAMDDGTDFYIAMIDSTGELVLDSYGDPIFVPEVLPVAAIPSLGANPTVTAGPSAVNGSATTYMRSDAAPAIQKASASQFGIVEVDGTTITASGGVISADITSGTWTPIDASGAGLSLTNNGSLYVKIGSAVLIITQVVWPSTADGSQVRIGGLPFTSAAGAGGRGTGTALMGGSIAGVGIVDTTATTMQILQPTNFGGITNAQMSGTSVVLSLFYFI